MSTRGESREPPQGAEQDWVSRLADEVVEEATRRQGGELSRPVVCASGLSPSGPIHLGNLREVMVPHVVADEIARRGIAVDHVISWDDYDRFRKVPAGVEGIDESWAQHIGKPLTQVPAPRGSSYPNWAEHFKAPMRAALDTLGVQFRGISQSEQYQAGTYRDQVLHAMARRADIDAVLARYRTKAAPPKGRGSQKGAPLDADSEQAAQLAEDGSGAAGEDDGTRWSSGDYYPFRPYCQQCGKDTTVVVGYGMAGRPEHELSYYCTTCKADPTKTRSNFTMDLDTEFHGKLVWKVDWPMRWAYEGVVFEPSGVDHQSPGSSFVVGGRIVDEIFGGAQPIGPMYAFVGVAGMAKMSSSRGGVPTPAEALALLEPALLRWLYVRRRPNQSFTVSFGSDLLRLYDEWDALERKIARGTAQPGDLAAHVRSIGTATQPLTRTPKSVPYRALTSIVDITGGHPEQTLRILSGFDVDGAVTSLDEVRPRLDKANEWVRTMLPDDERTRVRPSPDTELLASLSPEQAQALDLLAARLEDDFSLDGLTTLLYGIPKLQAGLPVDEKKLPPEVKAEQRSLFALLYRLLVGADTGPRLPTLLLCLDPARVRQLIGRD